MTEDLLVVTLTRIETKVDRLAEEVAEIRGARKMTVLLASFVAAVIGAVAGGWRK